MIRNSPCVVLMNTSASGFTEFCNFSNSCLPVIDCTLFLRATLIVNERFQVVYLMNNDGSPAIHSFPDFILKTIVPTLIEKEIQQEIDAECNGKNGYAPIIIFLHIIGPKL